MKGTRGGAARVLAPTQYGLGIKAGMDFVIHTMILQTERHITSKISNDIAPTRVLAVLDLINMFNCVSTECARDMLMTYLPWTVPLFDTLYQGENLMYFTKPDGSKDSFQQKEESQQGCPFKGLIANMILLRIYETLEPELEARAQQRLKDDCLGNDNDGIGSRAIAMSYINDITVSHPYLDLIYIFERFELLRSELGCRVSKETHKILTSTNNQSPRHLLSNAHNNDLTYVLNTYCGGNHGECTDGVRLLGTPIGNAQFIENF